MRLSDCYLIRKWDYNRASWKFWDGMDWTTDQDHAFVTDGQNAHIVARRLNRDFPDPSPENQVSSVRVDWHFA